MKKKIKKTWIYIMAHIKEGFILVDFTIKFVFQNGFYTLCPYDGKQARIPWNCTYGLDHVTR